MDAESKYHFAGWVVVEVQDPSAPGQANRWLGRRVIWVIWGGALDLQWGQADFGARASRQNPACAENCLPFPFNDVPIAHSLLHGLGQRDIFGGAGIAQVPATDRKAVLLCPSILYKSTEPGIGRGRVPQPRKAGVTSWSRHTFSRLCRVSCAQMSEYFSRMKMRMRTKTFTWMVLLFSSKMAVRQSLHGDI